MIFVRKLADFSFLRPMSASGELAPPHVSIRFTEDDDLDLCLYYLRTLSNVLRWAPDVIWGVLAAKTVTIDESESQLAKISKSLPSSAPCRLLTRK